MHLISFKRVRLNYFAPRSCRAIRLQAPLHSFSLFATREANTCSFVCAFARTRRGGEAIPSGRPGRVREFHRTRAVTRCHSNASFGKTSQTDVVQWQEEEKEPGRARGQGHGDGAGPLGHSGTSLKLAFIFCCFLAIAREKIRTTRG